MKKFYYLLWFLVLFTSFEGFGLRNSSWGGLGFAFLGWFGSLQLLVLLFSIVVPLVRNRKYFFNSKTKISTGVKLLFLLLLIIIFQSPFQFFLDPNANLASMLQNLVKFKFLMLYFVFVFLLSKKKGLSIAIKSVNFWAIVSSIILILIVITGYSNAIIQIQKMNGVVRGFRLNLPTKMLIVFSFYYFLSRFHDSPSPLYIVGLFLTFVAILLEMNRNIIIGITLVTFFALIKLYSFKLKQVFLLTGILGIIFLGVSYVFKLIGYSFSDLFLNYEITSGQVASGSGTFAVRLFLPINSFKYVVSKYLILGVGLAWEPIKSISNYFSLLTFYATPTFDSGYNNIIIIYGIIGMFVYAFLFYRLIKVIKFIISKTNGKTKSIAYAMFFTLIFALLTSFASDNFILQNGAVIFILIIALTYYLELQIRLNQHEKNYT